MSLPDMATAILDALKAQTSFTASLANVAWLDTGIVDKAHARWAAVVHAPNFESQNETLGGGYRRVWNFPISVVLKFRLDTWQDDTEAIYRDMQAAFEEDYTLGGNVEDCNISHVDYDRIDERQAVHQFLLRVVEPD